MSDVTIRPTMKGDLAPLADVLLDVHAADGYPVEGVENPLAWVDISEPIGQWTALLGGRAVGHIALMRPEGDDECAIISKKTGQSLEQIGVVARLFVSPSARGHGIGNQLLLAAETMAARNSITPILEVLEKDKAAMNLYVGRGWVPLGSTVHNFGEGRTATAIIMALHSRDADAARVER